MKKRLLIVLLVLIVSFGIYVATTLPRSDRTWTSEVSRTATAVIQAEAIALHNVRDFTYSIGKVEEEAWLDTVVVNPHEIEKVWFVLEPFGDWEAAGHTYLTFEFLNGEAYSFSVEARREVDEEYSALKGLFREYELAYTWGTERDFLTRRLLYLAHPVRMYPLTTNAEDARTLFLQLADRTNDIAKHPRFYNTFTANCTNVLAMLANESVPNSIPYDISWNFPGYSDTFLMRIGLIPVIDTQENTKAAYDLTPYREDIADMSTLPPREFSAALRGLPPFQNTLQDGITP